MEIKLVKRSKSKILQAVIITALVLIPVTIIAIKKHK